MTPIKHMTLSSLGFRKLGINIGQTFGRQLLALLFGVGTAAIIARMLGPAGNGQYAVAMLLPTFLSTLLNLGVSPGNVYYVGSHSIAPWVAARTSVRIWMGLTIVGVAGGAFSIIFYANQWFPGVLPLLLWLALLAFPLGLLQGFLSSLLQGIQDFRRYNLAILVSPAVMFVLVSVFLFCRGGSVATVVIAFVVAQAVNLIITCLLLHPMISTKTAPADAAGYAKQLIQYGYKAHLSNILDFINYRADVFLVNLLINPTAAGIYIIAVAMSQKLWLLSQAASTVILPRLSELHTDENARKQLTPFIARWVLIVTVLIAGLLASISVPLIKVLFGDAYLRAVKPLLFLLPGIVLGSLSRVLANDIDARGRPELNMYPTLIVVIVNVIGNLLLIPSMGIAGAALATTISYSLVCVSRIWIYAWMSDNRWYAPFLLNSLDQQLLRKVSGGIRRAGGTNRKRSRWLLKNEGH
jgi:O-antigen/teichoic acid export membrane protein